MNNTDKEYFRLLNTILEKGRIKKNRTGIDTIGVFGEQAKYDINLDAFPILTTKKVWFKGIVHELLWFIEGDTNIKYLVDNDVGIWNEWAYKRFTQKNPTHEYIKTQEQFIHHIKESYEFAEECGELGDGTYGEMWRSFPYSEYLPDEDGYNTLTHTHKTVDQLKKVVDKLKNNPDDRRMIVSAWHPYWVDHCALPPCHCLFHFNTEELTLDERNNLATEKQKSIAGELAMDAYDKAGTYFDELTKLGVPIRKLNCLLYQRSCDSFLGVPFNITSYCLLVAMVAHCSGMEPGVFTHTYGDLHLYVNHLDQVKEQLSRTPKTLPKLWLNPKVKSLFDFKYEDIRLEGYDPHPAIKGEVAV